MKMKNMAAFAFAALLSACGGTKVIDTDSASAVKGMDNVMELEYRDWTKTSERMLGSMLKSGSFAKVKNPVIAMGPMLNDTMQRFDTDILTKKIRTELLKSGQAQVATSFKGAAGAEDDSTHRMRELRGNAEYDKGTIASKGTLVAPNMSLSGKMLQRNMRVEGGLLSRDKERVEYYLQLTLTDLKTGLSVWEDEQPIIKEGKKAPRW